MAATLTEKSPVEPNDLAGEGKISIPTDPRPSVLTLKFNTKAYRMVQKMTGVEHFKRLSTYAPNMDIDFIIAAVFAGSRKYHPDFKLDDITDVIEDLDGPQLTTLWRDVSQVWVASVRGPDPVKEPEKSTTPEEESPLSLKTGGP